MILFFLGAFMCTLIHSCRSSSVMVCLLVIALAGCSSKVTTSVSKGGGRIGYREINFDVDGKGSFSTEGDAQGAVITTDGGKVTVQQTKLLLDGKEVGKVPDNAKVVLVEYKGGKLTVTADGKTIYPSAAGN